ncbi:MAG TPA: DUF2523 domain-containing protein [Methylophilaceae bacterium]|nr:DUF2523 domain-containing protein [Methylophilaceae bacterium]
MPLLVSALIGGLIQALGTIVGRLLISLGVGFVAYTGISSGIDYLKGQVVSRLGGLPADIVSILSLGQLDTAISITFSAIAVRLLIQGVSGGTFKKMVWK